MTHHGSYSAQVRLWLDTEHGRFPLAQVGPDFVITKSMVDRPEITSGDLEAEIDGDAKGHRVRLPEGIRHRDVRTPLANFE